MKKTFEFLRDCGVFYLATLDANDQPRNRPFGAVCDFEGKLYIITNNQKNVFKQMIQNPKVEITAVKGKQWIRLEGNLVHDPRREARLAMLEANMESLSSLYNADDGLMEVFYFTKSKATLCSFSSEPCIIEF